MTMPAQLSPHNWIAHLFSSKAASEGGVVRRKMRDIERYAGLDFFLEELERRGFTAIENAGQLVVFCNQEPIRIVTQTISSKKSIRSL